VYKYVALFYTTNRLLLINENKKEIERTFLGFVG